MHITAAVMGKLAGRTVFVSGASRGIGKAIALRCAQDGANIVVAAKTAEPHPKLPGTIYSAAEEMDKAGGKGYACIVDIRSEEDVKKAVAETVQKFGGIDILINNASAISLTGTEFTSMKKYDLMNGVNARGTYLCSKYCAPHLKKGKNPHILNISPPLNMNPRWFRDHVAYTMAKYGMSMCVLGMAEEFKDDGIAVNALWPKTAIYTAAMEMLGGGSSVKDQCRSVDIMSDAAYAILTRDSHQCTGNFFIDEEIMREEGVTDIKKYNINQDIEPMPDFFLDVENSHALKDLANEKLSQATSKSANSGLNKTFDAIRSMLSPELVGTTGGIFQFDLKDDGLWFLDLKSGSGVLDKGEPSEEADCVMTLTGDTFSAMAQGSINPTTAFMTGKLKIKGNLAMAMKLEKVLKKAQAKL